jgi:NAD+ dependent glucose-6-phosphate dehydrogenase
VMKRLVITGAAGRIGTALRPLLRPTYRLRLVDVRAVSNAPESEEELMQADASDLAAMERAMDGVDAVLHLAGQPSTAATWTEVRWANIDGTYAVFEAARRQGVGKVVFASTNHVMGMANLEGKHPVPTTDAVRPDSLYGVSKAFGEVLARYYSDAFEMSMICIRIGWFTDQQPAMGGLNPLWISARDLAQLFCLAIETPIRFGIYNGTSNNSYREWDLTATRDDLGFAPQDDVKDFEAPNSPPGVYVDPRAGVLKDSGGA